MKKLKTYIYCWGLVLILCLALFVPIDFLWNIFIFISWISCISYCMKANPKVHKALLKSYQDKEHMSEIMDKLFYSSIILILVAKTHWVIAILWLIIGSVDLEMRKESKKLNNK